MSQNKFKFGDRVATYNRWAEDGTESDGNGSIEMVEPFNKATGHHHYEVRLDSGELSYYGEKALSNEKTA